MLWPSGEAQLSKSCYTGSNPVNITQKTIIFMDSKEKTRYYTDEHVVRIIAAQVVAIAAISLVTQWIFPMVLLILDFALRAFTRQPSPLALVAKKTVLQAGLGPRPIFAAPKKFAATLGFLFSLTACILLLFHQNSAAFITISILIVCAILESAFKICLGCYVYDWLIAPVINRRNHSNT